MPGMPNLRPGLGRKAGAGPVPPAPQSWGSGAGAQSWWPLLPPVPLSRDFNLVTVTAPVVDSVPQRRRERGLVCRLLIRAMQTRAPRGGSETGERRRQRGRSSRQPPPGAAGPLPSEDLEMSPPRAAGLGHFTPTPVGCWRKAGCTYEFPGTRCRCWPSGSEGAHVQEKKDPGRFRVSL